MYHTCTSYKGLVGFSGWKGEGRAVRDNDVNLVRELLSFRLASGGVNYVLDPFFELVISARQCYSYINYFGSLAVVLQFS